MSTGTGDLDMYDYPKPQSSGVVTEVQNPITRYTVRLDPPFEYSESEQLDTFMRHFSLWCEAMWMIGRMTPEVFKAERGWISADPYWQLSKGEAPTTGS